jgi:hypothetical protein
MTGATQKPSAVSPPLSGWLRKMCRRVSTGGRPVWKRRHFWLRDGSLVFHEKDSCCARDCKLYVNLDMHTEILLDEMADVVTFLQQGRVVGSIAGFASAEDRDRWHRALLAARTLKHHHQHQQQHGNHNQHKHPQTAPSQLKLKMVSMAVSSSIGQRLISRYVDPAALTLLNLLDHLHGLEKHSRTDCSTAPPTKDKDSLRATLLDLCTRTALLHSEHLLPEAATQQLAAALWTAAEELLNICWLTSRQASATNPKGEPLHHHHHHHHESARWLSPSHTADFLFAMTNLRTNVLSMLHDVGALDQPSHARYTAALAWLCDHDSICRAFSHVDSAPTLAALRSLLQQALAGCME